MALITSANARQMAAKGHEAKRLRLEALRQTVDTLVQSPEVDYHSKRLARVRVQLGRIDDELERASLSDSKRIKELTEAQIRLAEQERILAGRPLPGSRKPAPERRPQEERPAIVAVPAPQSPSPSVPLSQSPSRQPANSSVPTPTTDRTVQRETSRFLVERTITDIVRQLSISA